MARVVAIVCAVIAGLGAALLLTYGPTATVNGHSRSCDGVLVASESGLPARPSVCDGARARWTWYAAGLGLVSLLAATGAALARRDEEESEPEREPSLG